ncbi:MAG TPA: TnpV protein [Micromonosporaceae bacterium]|nr:TnpV protein [Micromonosporaceae bacterium]HCU48910.1 TnpV protein [Micromonosporaceae bacterium]
MNKYGSMAMTHWKTAFPQEFSQIEDPASFFTDLGAQVAQEISQLEAELASRPPSGPGFLANLGQNRNARSQAEEMVLARLVWRNEELDAMDEEEAQAPAAAKDWTPLLEDPSDPWWQNQTRED